MTKLDIDKMTAQECVSELYYNGHGVAVSRAMRDKAITYINRLERENQRLNTLYSELLMEKEGIK
jgi:hypothetical protein